MGSEMCIRDRARGYCPRLPDCAPIAPLVATIDHTCLAAATMIFVAVPVQANAESFDIINTQQAGSKPAIVALCAKGIVGDDQADAMLLNKLAHTMMPRHEVAVFSGPSFADEVFSGLPAALVAAGRDRATKPYKLLLKAVICGSIAIQTRLVLRWLAR